MVKGRKIAPMGTARKPARARTRRCYLEVLPPELLREIFTRAELTLDQVVLSKRLLPSALEVLYDNVQLYSRTMLVKFAASIRAQPHLARVVKKFGLSGRDDPPDDEEEDDRDEWEDDSNNSTANEEGDSEYDADDDVSTVAEEGANAERTQDTSVESAIFGMGGLLLDSEPPAAPYEPEKLKPDDTLLRDLLRRLSSLENLLVFGRTRLHAALDLNFLNDGGLAGVKVFTVSLVQYEDWDEYQDAETCRRLQLLPSLQRVEFYRNVDGIPIDLENRLPQYRLEPRSWGSLQEVTLNEMSWIGPEIKHLFAAVQPGFRTLKIQALTCYDGLAEDFALLPNTLEALDVAFGNACWFYDGERIPSFDLVFTRFPRLRHLSLGGPLMSPGAIASLDELPDLRCLHLGYNLPLSGTALLALVQSPTRTIKHLAVHICMCPDPLRGSSRRRPRWHAEFGYSEACKLVRAVRKAGVGVAGNLLCAVKMCDSSDGHVCSRL